MSLKNRTAAIAQRKQEVGIYYVKGWTQQQIADKIGCSVATVCSDLQNLRKQWLQSAAMNFATRQAEELARLDHLESVAWQAWERSCKDAETRHKKKEYIRQAVKGLPGGHKLVPLKVMEDTITRGQTGDPRFLQQVYDCITMRMKVLGLLRADTNIQNSVVVNWDSLVLPPEVPDSVEEELMRNLPPDGPGSTPNAGPYTYSSLPAPGVGSGGSGGQGVVERGGVDPGMQQIGEGLDDVPGGSDSDGPFPPGVSAGVV